VQHFLVKHGHRLGKPAVKMSREAMQRLANYEWPGNVRELENTIERAVALCEGETIEATDLPEGLTQGDIAIRDLDGDELTLDALEEQHIKKVLSKVGGDKVRAAQILGINLSTLYRKLARYQR
jgi:two-component system response regulator HydG